MNRVGRLAAGFVLVVTACSGLAQPPDNRPAEEYATIEDLAAALEPAGLCDRFEDDSKRVEVFEFGQCWPEDADRGSSDFMSISLFPADEQYDKHKRWDRSGCNGPVVYGPNWNVGPLGSGEISKVMDAVGGEVVGFHEKGDC